MLNSIWLGMMLLAVVVGVINGRIPQLVTSVSDSANLAFKIAIGLTGIMAVWLGLMKIAEEAGLVRLLGRLLKPIMCWLFPEVPADHPAMGAMLLNIAANMLGLANAATPLGLKAMKELEKLNTLPGVASNAMCTFLAINTSSVQLIPATQIALLAAAGSHDPTVIIASSLLATLCSTLAGVVAVKLLEKLPRFRVRRAQDVG